MLGDPKRCEKIADLREYTTYTGVVQCKYSFYGQHSPEKIPVRYELECQWNAWLDLGCLGSEMESAIKIALEAIRKLIKEDIK